MRFSTTHCLHMIEIKMSKVIYFEPLKKHYNYKTFKLKYILDFNVKTFHPIRVSPLANRVSLFSEESQFKQISTAETALYHLFIELPEFGIVLKY